MYIIAYLHICTTVTVWNCKYIVNYLCTLSDKQTCQDLRASPQNSGPTSVGGTDDWPFRYSTCEVLNYLHFNM